MKKHLKFTVGDHVIVAERAAHDPAHGKAYAKVVGTVGVIKERASGYAKNSFDWTVTLDRPDAKDWHFDERNLDVLVSEEDVSEAIASIMEAMT